MRTSETLTRRAFDKVRLKADDVAAGLKISRSTFDEWYADPAKVPFVARIALGEALGAHAAGEQALSRDLVEAAAAEMFAEAREVMRVAFLDFMVSSRVIIADKRLTAQWREKMAALFDKNIAPGTDHLRGDP